MPDDSKIYDVEIRHDVRIPTDDPMVTLSGDLYLPVGAGSIPALVTLQPYRRDMTEYFWDRSFRWFAERGYACLLVEARGIGASDGVPRPRCHQGEGDDGVAAVEWAAAQPWCTGNVGMWGSSASGLTAMRTASRHAPALKAIIPMMNPLDSQRYRGARGDLGLIVHWAGLMLVEQIFPPLHNYTSARQQARWRKRMYEFEPFLMDPALHNSRHTMWRERLIDAEAITIPSFCVSGWRDLHCDQVIQAYERISGPKKLLIGPWGHTLPQDSPIGPIDFLSIALRWWDHWLCNNDTGMMDEPPITLHLEGDRPGWRTFESWPPAKTELILATGTELTLTESTLRDGTDAIGEYQPDPTIGTLAGLGGESAGYGLPLDQHDDDMRALTATSAPLQQDVLICGRPEVTVQLAGDSVDPVQRFVARLTEVDPQGRSSLISTGILVPDKQTGLHRITLAAVVKQVGAGQRLRVVLSDSDFPRLAPLANPVPIRVAGIEVNVSTVPEHAGTAVDISTINAPVTGEAAPGATAGGTWTITRDPIRDGVEINTGLARPSAHAPEGHQIEFRTSTRASVRRIQPDAFVLTGKHVGIAHMSTGEQITVTATIRTMQTSLWARGEVDIDGTTICSRTWDTPLGQFSQQSRPR